MKSENYFTKKTGINERQACFSDDTFFPNPFVNYFFCYSSQIVLSTVHMG